MTVFNWTPDYGFSKEVKPNVRAVSFGDGYEQRISDGINPIGSEWSLSFKRPIAIITAIENYLLTTKGSLSFDFLAPNGATYKVVAKDGWTVTDSDVGVQTLTVKFKRVFE